MCSVIRPTDHPDSMSRLTADRWFELLVLGGFAIVAATGCTASESNCRTDADCQIGARCVSSGGFVFGGGRCVPEILPADAGEDVDRNPDGAIGDGCDGIDSERCGRDRDTGGDDPDADARDGDTSSPPLARPGEPCDSDAACLNGYCEPADDGDRCAHVLFVSSGATDGDMGGIEGASSICRDEADASDLEGSWQPLLATGDSDATARIEIRGPVVNYEGDLLAETAAEFRDGELDDPVEFDATGQAREVEVWTGAPLARAGGGNEFRCDDWTSTDMAEFGYVGRSDQDEREWLSASATSCEEQAHVYCINGQ